MSTVGRSGRGFLLVALGVVVWGAAAAPSALAQSRSRYIAFGDSVTEGVGDSVPAGAQAGYPARLERLLGSDQASVRNEGRSGERSLEALTRLDEVLLQGGDVLLLMFGTNDITRQVSLESTVFNLTEMARKAERQDMEVVHATTIPRLPNARTDRDNHVNQELAQAVRNLAGRNQRSLVDNFELYGREADRFSRFYWVDADDPVGHPNPAGYDLMARSFADVLRDVDTVAPVLGTTSPNHGDTTVPAASALRLDVWDFGTGVDPAGLSLLVNGSVVAASVATSGDRTTLSFAPASPFSGLVNIGLRARDRATTPNTVDRTVIRFLVAGASPLRGDIELDGRVDGRDLLRLALAFGATLNTRRYDPRADVDDNGIVDGGDLALLAANFGRSL